MIIACMNWHDQKSATVDRYERYAGEGFRGGLPQWQWHDGMMHGSTVAEVLCT